MIIKAGSAHWTGPLRTGKGTVSTGSGALSEQPYGFATRFEDKPGTNPEELIAAAHAACFSMALSKGLEDAGVTDVSIATTAKVRMEAGSGGFEITASTLHVTVTGVGDTEVIRETAEGAKANCPVSKVLNCEVNLDLTINE